MSVIYPKLLEQGDTIGIISPGNWQNQLSEINRACRILKDWGFEVIIGQSLYNRHAYLAGTDEQRLRDFYDMWSNTSVKAILCWGNIWGATRLASQIDYEIILHNPKFFVGRGDVTTLLVSIAKNTNLVTHHGPTIEMLGQSDHTDRNLAEILTAPFPSIYHNTENDEQTTTRYPTITYKTGHVIGPIIGGNLSSVARSLGTPYEIETENKILFLEAHNDEVEFVERDLASLWLAGKLQLAKAIIFAESADCDHSSNVNDFGLEEVISNYLIETGLPAIYGPQLGFNKDTSIVPLNLDMDLNIYSESGFELSVY